MNAPRHSNLAPQPSPAPRPPRPWPLRRDAGRGRSPLRRLLKAALIGGAMTLVVLGLAEIPTEIARWHLAAGVDSALDGDYAAAIAHADDALAWSGPRSDFILTRARWKLALGDLAGCVADCGAALKLSPDDMDALQVRAEASQRLGWHDEAVADLDRIIDIATRQYFPWLSIDAYEHERARLLNDRAYFRARGGKDLDKALADIQLAFQLLAVEDDPAMLDTRGYVYFLLGDYRHALADLDRAVGKYELDYARQLSQLEENMQARLERRRQLQQRAALQHGLAVMYYHRYLAHRALDHQEQADRDLYRATELGFDPKKGVW